MIAQDNFTYINLVDMLMQRADNCRGRCVYTFLVDGEQEEIRMTFDEMDQRARAIGAWLQQISRPGERALLLYPPGLDYIVAYFGCLYAGVVAVPAYPPRLNRPAPRIQAIVADSEASIALTVGSILQDIEKRFEHAPDLQALKWLNTERMPTMPGDYRELSISGDTLAFMQYTSGSTSTPKGVMLTHNNLLHNLKQIKYFFRLGDNGLGMSWLPSYHDMGLIGGILGPIYTGLSTILMAPFAFLQRPMRWLEAISRYRATVSGAPNFAYDLCVERARPEQIASLDLSSWQVAFSGAEPVRMETIRRFAETFKDCGFQRSAFYPCYGLAEATLIVSGGLGVGEPKSISINRSELEQDRIVDCSATEEGALTLVNCGSAGPDQEIVIAHPQTHQRCPDNVIGEIWVRGPSIAQGYWKRPAESEDIFGAHLADSGEGPFMRTGDLGFLRSGELFITGRSKDLIIIRGSNHYPQDIESTVETAHSALQANSGAAFTVEENGEEHLVVVQELTRQARNSDLEEVYRAIRRAVSVVHELQLYAIILVRPMSIPKTSSGKIQRHACKKAFLEGELEVVGEWHAKHG